MAAGGGAAGGADPRPCSCCVNRSSKELPECRANPNNPTTGRRPPTRCSKLTISASVEESQARERLALEKIYGPDVRLLAEDDDKLLSYLGSEDLSLKRVACFACCTFIRCTPRGLFAKLRSYIVDGDDIEIRSLCVRYLSRSHNEEITSILRTAPVN